MQTRADVVGDDCAVLVDLADAQWNTINTGQLVAPDGTRFVRRTTRTARREADLLVAAGVPLVAYSYSAGQLDWYDGEDAAATWSELRTHLTSRPDAPRSGETAWTAGSWESSDGQTLLVLTGRC